MVVTRDFLGLGSSAMIYTDSGRNEAKEGEQEKRIKEESEAAAEEAAEERYGERIQLRPQLAPSWIGSMTSSGVNGLPHLSGNCNNVAMAGMNNPVWNIKSSTFQQFMALKSSLEEKYMEGSADSQSVHVPDIASRALAASHITYPNQNGRQLTIFYAGNISVYEDVPLDKAQTIMNMAANRDAVWPTDMSRLVLDSSTGHSLSTQVVGNAEHLNFRGQMGHNHYNVTADQASRSSLPTNHLQHQAESSTPSTPCSDPDPQLMVPRALPQARKASLARFLEKRKERMEMLSPYLKRNSAKLEQSATVGGNMNPIVESKFIPNFSSFYGYNSIVSVDYT